MKLRIGLAGYGRRGRGHIRALEMIDEGIVAAISDPIEASRRAAEAELDGISTYATVEEMIDNGDIQAVIVTAPAHLNGKVAMPAIERGLPVLVEKPPAMSSPELASMIERSELHGTKVMVAFNRRFNPLIQAAIDVIREAGPLHQMVAEFHKDIHDFTDDPRFSPAIFDLMLLESPIHSVDLFTHIADAPVANVVAIVKRHCKPLSRRACGLNRVRERCGLPIHFGVYRRRETGTIRVAWRIRIGLSRGRQPRLDTEGQRAV